MSMDRQESKVEVASVLKAKTNFTSCFENFQNQTPVLAKNLNFFGK